MRYHIGSFPNREVLHKDIQLTKFGLGYSEIGSSSFDPDVKDEKKKSCLKYHLQQNQSKDQNSRLGI